MFFLVGEGRVLQRRTNGLASLDGAVVLREDLNLPTGKILIPKKGISSLCQGTLSIVFVKSLDAVHGVYSIY